MIGSLLRSIRNAGNMVNVNKKNYVFLSVTIIISFSALGIYMFYSDSSIFNEHKEILNVSSKVAFIEYENKDIEKVKVLEKKLSEMKKSYSYTSTEIEGLDVSSIWRVPSTSIIINIHIIPNNVWAYYYNLTKRVEMNNGKRNLHIQGKNIIVSQRLYDLMKNRQDNEGNLYLKLPIERDNGSINYLQFAVSGICNEQVNDWKDYSDDLLEYGGYFDVFMSYDAFEEKVYGKHSYKLTMYTDYVKEIQNIAKDLGLQISSPLSEKEVMREQYISSVKIKEGITIGLLFLLGINLLSCFSNALSERRFEVSVRRAIGASKKNVIFQFFVEGIIVMLVDVCISIAVIMITMCGIKLYKWFVLKELWSIRITLYSIFTLSICCVFLSLFFSILFAVMSSKVEIVKYLKGE
ncbi:ABC transporter permease [uncultured Eubacterium sp.]|uniref:ABC transporter permease n=1 Tax=uncultured Eubacterium sp. TaxID=165185 RepID=UPI002671472A|nr:FtsX-like permease family protein [uncultured Eubacterium sp.]